MLIKNIITAVAIFAAGVTAVPVDNPLVERSQRDPTVTVINKCASPLTIGYARDVEYNGPTLELDPGQSHVYHFPLKWSGRIWGRTHCGGPDCHKSGMGTTPSSLAEFHFLEDGKNFYDISFVYGFNLPMVVEPDHIGDLPYTDDRFCKTSTCTTLPECPAGFETYDDNGVLSGCLSACSKFGDDEYCCHNEFNSPDICTTNSYAAAVKAVCPDVYSYAYDDYTSVLMCTSDAYTVTFC
ncbi:thaumatin [Pilobolus umbonatus]|nr:thaumatin [Pilobolus umbonatus]